MIKLQALTVKILRFVMLAVYATHFYKWKTKLQRFIFERKSKKVEVPILDSIGAITSGVFPAKYVGDDWRLLWDMMASPEHTEWLIQNQDHKESFDCDEFATGHLSRIKQAMKAGHKLEWQGREILDASYMMVMWHGEGWHFNAHHVCLLMLKGAGGLTEWAHVDYPTALHYSPTSSPQAVAMRIAKHYDERAEIVITVLEDIFLTPFMVYTK